MCVVLGTYYTRGPRLTQPGDSLNPETHSAEQNLSFFISSESHKSLRCRWQFAPVCSTGGSWTGTEWRWFEMTVINSLVPARFLTLAAHLVIVITIFWSRDSNVRACLPLDFTEDQYRSEDTRLLIALSVTLGLFAVELVGFFSGVSMFNSNQGLLSVAAHCSASVSLSFFVFQQWECWTYWIIFALCSVIPALCELVQIVAVLGLKKKPM